MTRLVARLLGATALLALAGAAAALVLWITATTPGTRWLFTTLVPLSGVSLTAGTIEGRLLDHLRLSTLRLGLAHATVEIDNLELDWQPQLLLAGTAAVQRLSISGVRIQDDTPRVTAAPELSWPQLSGNAQLLDVMVARLLVREFRYRRLLEQPVYLSKLAASITWQEGVLTIAELAALSPGGQVAGSVSTGFNPASLTADLSLSPAQPLAGMDRFTVQLRPGRRSGTEQLAATLTVAGSSGSHSALQLSGELGMAKTSLFLRNLSVTRPGQKGRITADGSLTLTALEPLLTLQFKADGLDLAPQLNVPTNLSGTLRGAGTLNSYRGDFSFANRAGGWQAATVFARYHGSRSGVTLAPLSGKILDGSLTGTVAMEWRDGFSLQAALSGRNFNPARLNPAWQGQVHFNAHGSLAWSATAPLTAHISGNLLESRLHGQALTGTMQADLQGNDLAIARLTLQGKGFDLQAAGHLKQRITLTAQVSDLALLLPGAAGTLRSEGWLRWHKGQLSAALTGTGSRLAYAGARTAHAQLTARLDEGVGSPLQGSASFKNLEYNGYSLDTMTLDAAGTLPQHTLSVTVHSGRSTTHLALQAGYSAAAWQGSITSLAGNDSAGAWKLTAPAAFAIAVNRCSLSPLRLAAASGERLQASAVLSLKPLDGFVQMSWSGVKLARANAYLRGQQLSGSSSGTTRIGFQDGTARSLTGTTTVSGSFSATGGSLTVQRGTLSVDGNRQGLQVGFDLAAADGGRVKGSYTSAAPFSLALPTQGSLMLDLRDINLLLLKPWLPSDTTLVGRVSGRATGMLRTGKRFELDGSARLSAGTLQQQRPDGELKLDFTSASAEWSWRGEALNGSLVMNLVRYGQATGTFRLPLPARLPIALNTGGAVRGTLSGQIQEKGLLTTLLPGFVQESSGTVTADLAISGSWAVPMISGQLSLSGAAAYLPTAGIHLKELQAAARLEQGMIRITSFRARSGSGQIDGSGLVVLDGWRVASYKGSLRGDSFQTVNFPELRILSSPRLTFDGNPHKLTVRGELQLPEVDIIGSPSRKVVAPSSDVIREGAAVPAATSPALALDVQIRLLLGDKVVVKVAGIDARLGGAVDLSMSRLDRITSRGEIKVIKGRYRTYGVNLEIVRGRLFFAGGPVDHPSLDVLALCTVGDVRAGVTVTGTLQRPVTRLYSEPPMPDVDVLAYIVLGHPLGSSGQQAGLLAQAAGALLTSGQAGVLQEQLKDQLGLSTLEIQGGVGGSSTAMGYKPLQVTAPGAIPETQQAGLTNTVLTVGKYLTPQLYISYGRSLFSGSNLFRLRYDIFKKWQIETQTGGGASGVDLYYKLEFN